MLQTFASFHPAIVHIPIGILMLYSVSEWLRLITRHHASGWNRTRAFLVIAGVLGALTALLSGEALENVYGKSPQTDAHSFMAVVTIVIYSILALAYVVWWIKDSPKVGQKFVKGNSFGTGLHVIEAFSSFMLRPSVAIIFASLGALALTVTGALGGALARGPDTDPLVSFIYSLLF